MVQNLRFILIVIFFSMTSCKLDRKSSIDRDKFTFRITSDSYLFFKNVRSIYYDIQDLPEAKWIAYRFGDRDQNAKNPSITPVIVVDWANNLASLLIEPNELLLEENEFYVREKNLRTGKFYQYTLKERGRENMLEFATKIYEGIMAENEIQIMYRNSFVPLFANDEEIENFRIVMSDYYRLTRIY